MSDMTKEIKEVIAKNLPQQVGEELTKRLQRCDELELSNKKLTDELWASHDEVTKLKSRTQTMEQLRAREDVVRTREQAVEKAELRKEVEDLKKDKACADTLTLNMKEMVQVVFKNPTVRKSYYENNQYNQHDSQNGPNGMYGSDSKKTSSSIEETVTEE